MDDVRIGFVGVGFMGQAAHLRNYVSVPGCRVVAISELRQGLGKAVALRYGVPRVYTSHSEMIEAEELDGIVAAQPFRRHGVLVPELLKARVPVFIEKPLAASVEAGERIVDAVRESGTWLMVGYHKRSDPAVAWARTEIERLKQSGELGALRYVRILMPAGDWIAGGDSDMIRTDEAVPDLAVEPQPGDMDEQTYKAYISFVNYYIHQVNLMRYMLGEPYRVAYADPRGVVLAAESRSGVSGIIEMSPYRTTLGWQESVLVAFEHGYIKVRLPAPLAVNRAGTAEVLRDPGGGRAAQTLRPCLPPVHAMKQQAGNFVSAVRGESRPPCEAAEALEDLLVARDYIRLARGH
jgi:predicted dehydrogenase